MKSVTMDFEEYEAIVGERNKSNEELENYKRAIKTIYGEDAFKELLSKASQAEDAEHRMNLRQAMIRGEL